MPLKIDNVYRVKESCSLDYPNGECWARRGQFVYVDWDKPEYRTLMHGQESRIRNLTPEEREAGGEVVPIDPKFAGRVPGYLPEQDRMFRLERGDVVTKRARATARKVHPVIFDAPPDEDDEHDENEREENGDG